MPVVKPLAESLQKELVKEQEQAALKHQLRAYRKWFSALDRNPPQREVVPGYAQGGRVWSPGYAATQLSSPAYQQYTPQELEYIRLLEEKNRQAGAGTAFDVIPGNVVEPTMRVGYTPQEQEYIRLLAEKDKPKQELVQLLEPQDVRTRQEIIFRGETPEQVAERNAETVRDLVGPRGNWATEQEALESVRKLRAAADKYGGTLRVFEDGGVAAEDKDGYSLVSAEWWERTRKAGNLTGSPEENGYRIVPEMSDQPVPTPGPPGPSRRPGPPLAETPMPIHLTPEGLTPFHKQFSENFIKNFVNRGSEHAKEGLDPELAAYAEHLDVRPDWPAKDYRSKDQDYSAYYQPKLGETDVYVPVRSGGQAHGKGINADENLMRHELLHGVLPFLGIFDVPEQHAAIELIYPVWQQLQARGIELTRAMVMEMVDIANSYGIQGTDEQGHASPEETALLQQRVPELVQKYSGNSRGGRVVVPGYAEGGRVWSPGYAANRLSSPAYDDEEEQRRRNGGYTDQELAYIRLLEQKQGGGAFDVIPGTGYQAQPTMRVGYTPKELEYIRLLEEKEKEPEQWRPGYAADKLEESVEATAARLNPAASAYEAGRQVEPGLRPSNVDKNPFASLNVFERQEEIFRGMEPGTRAARAISRLSDEEKEALVSLAFQLEYTGLTVEDLATDAGQVAVRSARAERYADKLRKRGLLDEDEYQSIRRGKLSPDVVEKALEAQIDLRDPGRAALWDIWKEKKAADQASAPALGPIDIGYSLIGQAAGRGARAAGAPEPLAVGIETAAPIVAGVATGRLPGRIPGVKPFAAAVGGDVPRNPAGVADDALRLADDVPAIRDDIIPEAGMQPGARTPRVAETPTMGAEPPTPTALREPDLLPPSAASASPSPVTGGAPLTAEQIAARRAPIRETFAAKPAREAREAWRRYDGAIKVATIQQSNWADETYRLARQSKTPIVRGLKQPTSDAQVDLMERVFGAENRRDPIGTFQPNQRETMQRVYDYFDETTNLALERIPGFDQRALPEYATHMFVQRNVQRGGKGGINLRPGFLKHREATGTLGEILAARPDLDLATWDPVELAVLHRRAVENYIAGLDELRDLRALGLLRPVEVALPGWRTPDITTFKMAEEVRGWVAHPQVATRLEQQFAKQSFFDAYGPANAVKGLRETLFKLKVAGGLFQGIDFTARAIGRGTAELAKGHPLRAARAWFSPIHSVARSVIPGLDRAMLKRVEQNPILLAGYRNGLSAGVDTSLADQAIRGMGSFVPQTVMGRQIPGAKPLAQVLEFVSGGAYQKFHRDMLEQDYLINFEKFKRGIDLPGGLGMGTRRELDDIARMAAEDTNVFYSSLPNWQSAIRSATGRDLAKLGAFAPGEVEAWFRLPFQSPAGFAGIIGATVIAAELLNKHFTGEWLSEEQLMPYTVDKDEWKRFKKDPASIWKSGVPGVDYNTKFLRPELPWQGPDGRKLYLDLLGQADTPFRWALDPKFAIQTRLGQIPSALMDLKDISSGNAPPFGEKVEGPADFGRWAAQEVSPIALQGLGGTERGRIGTLATGVQAGGLNISAEPIGERKQRKLDELFEQGYFPERAEGGAAAGVRPTIDNLLTTERAKLKEDFPELFSDPGEEFKQDVREGVTETERDVLTGDFIASAKQTKHSILDSIMRDARTGRLGDLSEDPTRKRLWEEGRDALQEYRAKVDEARKLNPSDWEPEDPTHKRTLDRFYKLISSLPEIPADADWERFDKGMGQFSEDELLLIEQVTGEGDHAFEKARREANKKLDRYWEADEEARPDIRAGDAEIDGLLWAIGNGKVRSSDHIDEALDAFEAIYGYRPPRSAVSLTEGATNYESAVRAMENGSFNFEEDRSTAASTIDDALPPNDPRRKEYERMSSQVGEGSQYDSLESGKPRENFREQNPEIDAILWVLGKTSVVRSAAAGRRARELYQQLWGVTPPWPRLAER